MLRDVFTGCQPFDQVAVKLPAGSIVDIGNVSLRLVKPGTFDQALQAVAFAVFNVDQQTKTILERTSFILGSSICVIKASDIEVSRISMSLSMVLWLVMILTSCRSQRCE